MDEARREPDVDTDYAAVKNGEVPREDYAYNEQES